MRIELDPRDRIPQPADPDDDDGVHPEPRSARGRQLVIWPLVLLAALNGPWIIEGTGSNCAAAERVGVRKRMVNPLAAVFSDGVALSLGLGEKFPYVPPPVSCAMTYWVTFLLPVAHAQNKIE
jgi:hypothetical protein